MIVCFFFFNDTATTEIYTLSLHDALPISNDYTAWYDSVNALVYVNLGGLNPNNEVMTFCDSTFNNIQKAASAVADGPITIDGLNLVNSLNGTLHLIFGPGSQKCSLLNVSSSQSAGYNSSDNQMFQIQGDNRLGYSMPEFSIEGLELRDAQHANGLALLNVSGTVHDFVIDNVSAAMGLWNDCVDMEISKGVISNTQLAPNQTTNQFLVGYGVLCHAVGSGGINGRSYRNRISGVTVLNSYGAPFFFDSGSWALENCTMYSTDQQTTAWDPLARNYSVGTRNYTGDFNALDVRMNNCRIVVDQTGAVNRIFMDSQAAGQFSGDHNSYYVVGPSLAHFGTVAGTAYDSLAAWQATTGMDANSTLTIVPDRASLPFVAAGTFAPRPVFAALPVQYMVGADVTPTVSVPGRVIWSIDMVAPALGAGDLTQTAGGTLAAVTYYVRTSWNGPRGETLTSGEQSLAVLVDNVLNVAAPASPPAWATAWNVYVSDASGTETRQNLAPIGLATAWVEPTTGLVVSFKMPVKKPPRSPAEDATGEAFYPIPEVGGVQFHAPSDPLLQKRAGGGW